LAKTHVAVVCVFSDKPQIFASALAVVCAAKLKSGVQKQLRGEFNLWQIIHHVDSAIVFHT